MNKKCQCCGNYVFSLKDCGTEAGGQINTDFCSDCYKSGYFIARDTPVVHNDLSPFKRLFAETEVKKFFGENARYNNLINRWRKAWLTNRKWMLLSKTSPTTISKSCTTSA